MVSFSIGASVLATQAWAQAPGDTPADGGGSADESGSGSAAGSGGSGDTGGSGAGSGKNSAAGENLKAQESLPQVTAARGGSFGIPSSIQTAGLHAAVDAQLFDDKSNTDAFAQLAGLRISSRVSVDVVGQSVSQDVQRFVLDGNTAKSELYTASLSAAGMRVRIRGEDVLVVSHLQSQECLDALAQTVKDTDGESVSFLRLIGDGGLGISSTDDDKAKSVQQQIDSVKQPLNQQALKSLADAQAAQTAAKQKLDEKQKVLDALTTLRTAEGIEALDSTKPAIVTEATDARDQAKKELDDATAKVKAAETDQTTITAQDRDGKTHKFLASTFEPKLKAVKSACKVEEIKGLSGPTWTFGAHVLRRASNAKDGKASVGGALEAMYQRDNINRTAYLGLSFEYLNHAMDKDSGAQFDFVSFHALRVSAGYEYRGSHSTDGSDLLPRVGVYGVASYGWWHDKYTFASAGGTIDEDVHSTELEAGLYAGGKFTNNFTGMLALRVLKPFGDFNQGTTFIISLIPAVSAGK